MMTLAASLAAADMPEPMQQDIEYARELCRAVGQRFRYDYEYIDTSDLNGDGRPDYVFDGRGIECEGYNQSIFGDAAGKPFYLYISNEEDGWDKVLSAYVYEYYIYPQRDGLPVLDLWLRGQFGYQTNRMRYRWNEDKLEVIEQETGVDIPENLWKNFD